MRGSATFLVHLSMSEQCAYILGSTIQCSTVVDLPLPAAMRNSRVNRDAGDRRFSSYHRHRIYDVGLTVHIS